MHLKINLEKLNVLCLSPAGVGTSFYQPWQGKYNDIEITPIALPGKDGRYAELPPESLEMLADQVTEEVKHLLMGQYILVGYSMGGMLAYELLRRWHEMKLTLPSKLFVIASTPPTIPLNRKQPFHKMTGDKFREELRNLGGTPQEVINNDELMSIYEPIIRHDFKLCETYLCKNPLPIPVDIHAYSAEHDTLIRLKDMEEWKAATSSQFRINTIKDSSHMLSPAKFSSLLKEIRMLSKNIFI